MFNGGEFDTVESGILQDVPVEYVNGTPMGTNVHGIIQIPNPMSFTDVMSKF